MLPSCYLIYSSASQNSWKPLLIGKQIKQKVSILAPSYLLLRRQNYLQETQLPQRHLGAAAASTATWVSPNQPDYKSHPKQISSSRYIFGDLRFPAWMRSMMFWVSVSLFSYVTYVPSFHYGEHHAIIITPKKMKA